MFETLPLTTQPAGAESIPAGTTDVILYGLSTCGHCARGRAMLDELGVSYRWTHLDLLEPAVRRPALAELRRIAGERVLYPVLEVGGTMLFGFIREDWLKALREHGLIRS